MANLEANGIVSLGCMQSEEGSTNEAVCDAFNRVKVKIPPVEAGQPRILSSPPGSVSLGDLNVVPFGPAVKTLIYC